MIQKIFTITFLFILTSCMGGENLPARNFIKEEKIYKNIDIFTGSISSEASLQKVKSSGNTVDSGKKNTQGMHSSSVHTGKIQDNVTISDNKIHQDMELLKIKDPIYLELRKEESDILQGRTLWNEELTGIDRDLSDALDISQNVSHKKSEQDISNLLIKKMSLLQKLFNSQEYKEYIISKQARIQEISILIVQYIPPKSLSSTGISISSSISDISGSIR